MLLDYTNQTFKRTNCRFNAYDTLNVTHLEAEEIVRFYSALKDFLQILDSKANQIWIPLMQNQILVFDNFRLLHGRSQFKGNRSLITAYISRDDWLSKAHIMGAF
jgi:trimethyllysine dioxygenase